MPFSRPGPAPVLITRTPSPMVRAITLGLSLGFFSLVTYYTIITTRAQATLVRRGAQALEMKVLRARLDRFHAKIDGGQVMGEEEMQEGKRMEKLFRRWLRSMEDDAAADVEGRSAAVKVERWPGWF